MPDTPPAPAPARIRPSRLAAALLLAAVAASLWPGLQSHIAVRVPLALAAAWGLWRRRRWGYGLTVATAAVWLLMFVGVVPFLVVPLPGAVWLAWLYWLASTALAVAACGVQMSAAGYAERARWPRAG